MEELTEYRVTLHEDEGDKFKIVFYCNAKNDDDAENQALESYPASEIVLVTRMGDRALEGRGQM